eukprot:7596911-Pyramimonas_sp.AAC.1
MVVCLSSGSGGSQVRNRLGSLIRVPTLSGKRRSAHSQGLGLPPLKGLGARLRVRPPCCRPTLGPIQASCLVIGPDAH